MLAVDIAQAPRQFLEQRRRHRTPAREGPRLAVGQDLALDDQFAVLRLHALRKPLRIHFEDSCDPRPLRSGAHHLRRRAPAQQQGQRIHHDRLAATGLAGQQIQPAMKAHPHLFHHGVVFDG